MCGPSFPSPLETSLAAPVELRKQVEFLKRPRDPFAVGAIGFFQRPASGTPQLLSCGIRLGRFGSSEALCPFLFLTLV